MMSFGATTYASRVFPAPKGMSPRIESKSILIIEDEYSIRQMMKDVLELEGYTVRTAGDGAEGFQILKNLESPPRAIILDLMMPGTNGWRFLDFVRNDPATAAIPVVVCSAYNESAKSVSPDAIIEKPVRLETLLNTINSFCD